MAAKAIGMGLGMIGAAESAALIGAGLLSVLIFPAAGLSLLRRGGAKGDAEREPARAEAT